MKKKMTLAHIFAYNSKSILRQSASFSHAGTHFYLITKLQCGNNFILYRPSTYTLERSATAVLMIFAKQLMITTSVDIVNLDIVADASDIVAFETIISGRY